MKRAGWFLALLYAGALFLLSARAPLRTIGDGGEYLAYALALSHGFAPAMGADRLARIHAEIAEVDPLLAGWRIEDTAHRAPDGRYDFVHFWGYSALAAPWVALSRAAGADPRVGFTVLNVGLLALAWGVAWRRLGWGPTVLLLAGPIIWWSDKAHVEALIVSLMTIAFAIARDRPGLAMACAGLVSAQAPPFAVFIPAIGFMTGWRDRAAIRRSSFVAGGAAAVALAALPSLYSLARFGKPSLLAEAARRHWPSGGELGAVLFDLNIGLLANWPLFGLGLVVGAATLVAKPRERLPPEIFVTAACGLVLVTAFTQVGNFMHGGTPGMIRYGIWLAPLAVPLLAATHASAAARRSIAAIALASAAVSVYRYEPSRPEFSHRPTRAALWAWRHVPAWSHPRADVFARSLDQFGTTVPIASPECGKILLVGRGEAQGMWPRPCPPAEVPPSCRVPGVLCYASRSGRSYAFRRIDHGLDGFAYDPRAVWPRRAETGVRLALVQADWWSMDAVPRQEMSRVVTGAAHVRVEHVFAAAGRALLVLSDPGQGARVTLRAGMGQRLSLGDGETGRSLPAPSVSMEADGTRVLLPADHRWLVLVSRELP